MVRVSSVGTGGWQRVQVQPPPARTHVAATGSRPDGGPHAAHTSPSGVERQRRPPHLQHVCHDPVSKIASGAADRVRVAAHLGHGAVGDPSVNGSTQPDTRSDGSTIRGRVGDTRRHAGTNPPFGGQTSGAPAETTVTGPKTSTTICSATVSAASAVATASTTLSGPSTPKRPSTTSRTTFSSSSRLTAPPADGTSESPDYRPALSRPCALRGR